MPNLFAFSNRHDIGIDFAIALRRSVLMVSTLANFFERHGTLLFGWIPAENDYI